MKTRWQTMLFSCGVLLLSGTAFAQEPIGRSPVPEDHWAYMAVTELMLRGVLEGYPDGRFRGKRAMTREEFAVAIERFLRKRQETADKHTTERTHRSQFLAELAQEINTLAKTGPDLLEIVPQNHEVYAFLKEMNKKDLVVYFGSPLTRYKVVLYLRGLKSSLFGQSSRLNKEALSGVIQKTNRVEGAFRADIDALEALMKRKGYKESELPISVDPLREALERQKNP